MALINGTQLMSRPLLRLLPSTQSVNVGLWHRCSVATAPPPNRPHHPNPGNFSNRPREELSEIGHKGGKRVGKPPRAIASKGGRAGARNKPPGNGETESEAERRGRSHEPSVVPPGFEEWKTMA
ncbi:hypothetical protein N7537_006097 [Penicillium hordei]|uniref:Uncharacterized protein n=1 Tax=Penicillium hordei TaxID=40994 RepID=A0AAD6E724_9EURO|nr:uncharacterized protein N7537_006097 [Penicillium hordei]KAJ5603141.1 hypothetical protein N7537_006097 [Penicillium hordei]